MSGSGVVRFSQLPDRANGVNTRWHTVAAELRGKPGAWARVSTHRSKGAASAQAHAIKTGRLLAFRPVGGFEAVVRGVDVWARFVGIDGEVS